MAFFKINQFFFFSQDTAEKSDLHKFLFLKSSNFEGIGISVQSDLTRVTSRQHHLL
jgi:hypothetical protein